MNLAMALPGLGFAGGAERYAHELSVALRKRGHSLRLIHGQARGRDSTEFCAPFASVLPLGDPHAADGVDCIYVLRAASVRELEPFGRTPLAIGTHDHALSCPRQYRYLPLSLRPCHRPPGMACILAGCCIVRERGPDARLPIGLRSPFRLRRRLLELSRRGLLVACSRYVADNIVAAGVAPGRVRVVRPIPPDDERPPIKAPLERRLLVVGQLLRGKGVDIAIRALHWLPADVTLEVVGEGPSRSSLERLAQRVASGRVHFSGYVPPEKTRECYDRARVVLVPSRWPEPFGMVGIEAMRRGRAVVGSAHGGILEWLEDGSAGALFTPGSPEALARAVDGVMGDETAGARAHAFGAARFRHSAAVDEMESLLASIASDGRPRA